MSEHNEFDIDGPVDQQVIFTTEVPNMQSNFILIVGTSTGGVFFSILIPILILICVRITCLKRKTYYIPNASFKQKIDEVCLKEYIRRSSKGQFAFNADDSISLDNSYLEYNLNYALINQQYDYEKKNSINTSSVSARKCPQSSSFTTESTNSASIEKTTYVQNASLGTNNLAYESDNMSISCVSSIFDDMLPTKTPKIFSNEIDLHSSPALDIYRKNRMKKDTAAAIAYQKHRETSVYDDTDFLIENNLSFVVYRERTAV